MCPRRGETTPQVDHLGRTRRCWGQVPHRRLGIAAWTYVANGEGDCLPLLWTRHSEVKQGKSGGFVATTDQGKGKGRRVERPMGTTAYGAKGQAKGNGG